MTKKPLVVAIFQARMGSTRLPGKTLVDICGKPLIVRVLERVCSSNLIDRIMIATTQQKKDEVLLKLASELCVHGYAGSVDDVLDRFYQAAKMATADIIVRITPDDPFKDPEVIDEVIGYFLQHENLDYASNTICPTYPDGLDVEVFSFYALEKAWKEAKLPSEREHVTPYIWKQPDKFNIANIENDENLSHLRWTIDYEEDLLFALEVYSRMGDDKIFLMRDILELLEKEPELLEINKGIERNIGYKKSLDIDKYKVAK